MQFYQDGLINANLHRHSNLQLTLTFNPFVKFMVRSKRKESDCLRKIMIDLFLKLYINSRKQATSEMGTISLLAKVQE